MSVIKVAIVESTILGVRAYFARCLSCGVRCHRQAHARRATATTCARAHRCTP